MACALLCGCDGDKARPVAHTGHTGHEASAAETERRLDTVQLDGVLRSPNTFVIADLETVSLSQREIPLHVKATGRITYDPRAARTISARADGWIERLHVKYRYQRVWRGAPLMELNSRELLTAQENHLMLTGRSPRDPDLITASAKRLELLGLDPGQVAVLERTRMPQRSVAYYSPIPGHLHENDPAAASLAPTMPMSGTAGTGLSLREGDYVEKGRTIFTIYGTDPLLVLLDVHPDQQMHIRVGQRVSVLVEGAGAVKGKVDLIEPSFREGGSFASVRVYVRNRMDSLVIGSRCTATIDGEDVSLPVVPASALVSTGLRSFVFVREGEGFRSREVATGLRSDAWVEVRSGITLSEDIARNAQMLIDSEAFLKNTTP